MQVLGTLFMKSSYTSIKLRSQYSIRRTQNLGNKNVEVYWK